MANAEAPGRATERPSALFDAGMRHFRAGQLAEAEEKCLRALAGDPRHADSLYLLGMIQAETSQVDLAIQSVAQAIRNDQANPDYFASLGALLARSDRLEEAFKSYDLALSLKPDFVAVWLALGGLLQRQQRFQEALLACQHAISLDPNSYEGHNELGKLLMGLARYGEAAVAFEAAAKINARAPAAFNNLGVALTHLKRLDEAVATLDRAVALSPGLAEPYDARANALRLQNRLDAALADYDRAIALKPGYAAAYNNRGACLDDLARPDEALASYSKALALQPDHGDTHWNLAVNRLRAGDFSTGWREAEWRWKSSALRLKHRGFDRPLWLGDEPIEGKVLLLHNEQGLGDAIQFCRYIPLLARCGARVVLEIDGPLKPLLAGLAGVAHCFAKGEALPDFDFHCPLSSLPLVFDTILESIPSSVPYLSAPATARDWKAWLGASARPRIGLVWSGNPIHVNDHNRSIALQTLSPLLKVEAEFISLQKNLRAGDHEVLRECGVVRDSGPELENFADTAALIAELDLVITVDTSVAHLAGSLGKPVWILLPFVADWRWLTGRADSPWYPTARLFRQSQTRNWTPVVRELCQSLQSLNPLT